MMKWWIFPFAVSPLAGLTPRCRNQGGFPVLPGGRACIRWFYTMSLLDRSAPNARKSPDYSDEYSIWDALDGEAEAAGNIDYEW